MRHLLGILLLGMTGCHFPMAGSVLDSPSRTGTYGSYGTQVYGTRTLGQPLRATLWFDEYSGITSFEVSRPAHVAIFALQPMGVLEMVYPRYGSRSGRAFRSGTHSIRTVSRAYHLAGYRSAYGAYGAYGRGGASAPTYLILIASERPLNLRSFGASGYHPWLSRSSVTWNPFTATDELAREIVMGSRSSEWTSAYYVTWPDTRFQRYDGRVPTTRVACPGNVWITVPNEALRNGWFRCPDDDRSPRDGTPRVTDRVAKRPRPEGPIGEPAAQGRPLREIDRPARPGAPEQGSRPLRPERPERPARPAKPETPRTQRPVSTPAPERPTRPERPDRPDRVDRPEPRQPTPVGVRPPRAAPTSARPEARPSTTRPGARPSATRPARTSRPAAHPARRPTPQARPRPAPRPEPAPKPAKKKKKGGG